VAQKAHVKAGTTIAVINRAPGIVESLALPKSVEFVKPANAQLVFLVGVPAPASGAGSAAMMARCCPCAR
jgi:hypothetical protein